MIYHVLTRKIQERQVICEGAYPLRSVTEQIATCFVVVFRAVFKCKQDKEREYFLAGVYIDVHDLRKTQTRRSIAQYFKTAIQKSTR